MWISKNDRNKMASDRDAARRECLEWKAKYEAATEDKITLMQGAIIISQRHLMDLLSEGEKAKAEVEMLRQELESWKQKYADEVQKRLALIEQTKG